MNKKNFLFIKCLFALVVTAYSQSENYFSAQWKTMKPDVSVSFANSNIRYYKDRVPKLNQSSMWQATAWKGEKINTQILIWTKKQLNNVSFSANHLVNERNESINEKNISFSFIKYVWTDGYFGNGCGKRNNQQLDSSLVADLIDTSSSGFIDESSVQPVWLTIKIPSTTKPGIYKGEIFVKTDKKIKALTVVIQVQNYQLPNPSEWTFDLDLWQYPVSIAKYHKVPLWGDEHYTAMKPYYTMLANAGQKVITISMIEGGNQGKEVSPAMIKWIKKKNGEWVYDYTLFDRYVSFVMSCGINKRINCYTMVPWSMEFSYYDEATAKDTFFTATTQSNEYRVFWQSMLSDFTKHLKEKKWFTITSIAMDERKLPDMHNVISMIRDTDKDWKISLAGAYHAELVKEIYDYSVFKSSLFSNEELQYRNAHNMPSTFYTSCEGEKPNMFTFSSPAEATWMGWYAAAKGFSGYLRWAYNLWNENPLQDTRSVFPAGDAFQIYPGPRNSVRFEKLIEGIQDFEKIRILRETYSKKNNKAGLNRIDKLLSHFENERLEEETADSIIVEAKKVLKELSYK